MSTQLCQGLFHTYVPSPTHYRSNLPIRHHGLNSKFYTNLNSQPPTLRVHVTIAYSASSSRRALSTRWQLSDFATPWLGRSPPKTTSSISRTESPKPTLQEDCDILLERLEGSERGLQDSRPVLLEPASLCSAQPDFATMASTTRASKTNLAPTSTMMATTCTTTDGDDVVVSPPRGEAAASRLGKTPTAEEPPKFTPA